MKISDALAFKAQEIEELADVYFFRPLGALAAWAAMPLGISPTAMTIFAGVVGTVGGYCLYDDARGLLGFALLILHGIFDSADGQLARLTGRTSEFGRILDGLAGYVAEGTAYVAIAMGHAARTGDTRVFGWMLAAGVATIFHAQMYDYHRTIYGKVAIRAQAPDAARVPVGGVIGRLSDLYHGLQHSIIGRHVEVETVLRARSRDGSVSRDDIARYRAAFYWPVRGWNLLGDNTRFYAIGAAAWLHHLPWFFYFVLGPMSLAFVVLWIWQQRADGRFLAALSPKA